MSRLAIHAELLKLSRLLGSDIAALEYLSVLDVTRLRALRAAISDSMFSEDRTQFGKLAAATKLIPGAVLGVIAEKALGPMLCARVAGLLDPVQAVDVAKRVSVPFLADLCLELDPRSAVALLQRIPVTLVTAVADALERRREYVTMARFVDALPDAAIRAVAAEMPDRAVLEVGLFVESAQRLSGLVALFDDARLRSIIQSADQEPERLWPAALSLMEQVEPAARARLARLGIGADAEVLTHLIDVVQAQGLWDSLVIALAALDEVLLLQVSSLPAVGRPPVLEGLAAAGLQAPQPERAAELLLAFLGALPGLREALLRQPEALRKDFFKRLGKAKTASRLKAALETA